MQRTNELFPADTEAPVIAETPVAVAAQPEPNDTEAPFPPRFVSEHFLYMQITKLAELPSGDVRIRQENNQFKVVNTGKIPMHDLPRFHEQIAEGNVSVLWGYRYKEFDELPVQWTEPRTPTRFDHHCRRHRLDRRARTHDSDGC